MISERAFAQSFDSFWHELLPLLTARFVAVFNESCGIPLRDVTGVVLSALPMGDGVERPDLVAELAFRLARLAHDAGLDCTKLRGKRELMASAEKEAFQLIQRYEGEKPSEMVPLTRDERAEGLRLCGRYKSLYAEFESGATIEFCPAFKGAGFLNSSEGDIGIGETLIEVKTTTRKPAGKDLRQLLVYLALDANAGKRWSSVGLFNPRRGTLHFTNIDPLILSISGGKAPSDVFSELISFTLSNEHVLEQRF